MNPINITLRFQLTQFAGGWITIIAYIATIVVPISSVFGEEPKQTPVRDTIPTLCKHWLQDEHRIVAPFAKNGRPGDKNDRLRSECKGYTEEGVNQLIFVVNDIVGGFNMWSPDEVASIFPGPPIAKKATIKEVRITNRTGALAGYVRLYPPVGDSYGRSWRTPYQLPPGWVYQFNLHRVPHDHHTKILSKLGTIERTNLYGEFKHSQLKPLPYVIKSDKYARFARYYDLSDKETRDGIAFPLHWTNALKDQPLKKLWVECAIPIDQEWFPVGNPLRTALPIALQTTSDLYLVSQEVRPQRVAGGMFDHFEGRVIDLSSATDLDATLGRVVETLVKELAESFDKHPLSSRGIRKGMAPNQVRFQRRFERSEVLKGLTGPYYELSTYSIILWAGPNGSFFGSAESYFSQPQGLRSKPEDQIFLQLSQSLQIAVGRKGDYEEPSSDQYVAYQKAVARAIDSAVARTTSHYHGKLVDGIGRITAARKNED